MRNIQKLVALLFMICACSCTQEDVFETSNTKELNSIAKTGGGNTMTPANFPVYSQNELIVQYKDGTPDAMKFSIREAHGIDGDNANVPLGMGKYEMCRCDNKNVEKWIYDLGSISIEPKRQVISGSIGNEIHGLKNIDYNFVASFDVESPITGTAADDFYESYIKTSNAGITIAILDTGVATGLDVFDTGTAAENRFLYNASEMAIGEEKSGYDFVEDDVNTFDDDPYKHGSIIADKIHNALEALDIDHQILPLKIADNTGTIEYFNMLCGFIYAAERAQIINASFGWYGDPFGDFDDTILEDMIGMFPNTIVVTSAGNTSLNNDIYPHYPSSFEVENVISVGSCEEFYGKVSDFSNYGTSVDFFTKGEEIPFYTSTVQGTSFAAPQITIQVAKIMDAGIASDLPMVERVAALGYDTTPFFRTVVDPYTGEEIMKYSFYGKYIPAED